MIREIINENSIDCAVLNDVVAHDFFVQVKEDSNRAYQRSLKLSWANDG